jgi:uncharacterized protein
MTWLTDLIGKSPYGAIIEHTVKVMECVHMLEPAAQALIDEDYEKLDELHHQMSTSEHEADEIKNEIRKSLSGRVFLSVNRGVINGFLAAQDDVADRAEDFLVVLTLRETKMHPDLKEEFMGFVDKVICTAEGLLVLAQELKDLADTSFSGKEAEKFLNTIDCICENEWETDKLQRRFARHFYSLENEVDPITVFMYDKYCRKLGQVANAAEKAAKYMRIIVESS